MLFLQWIKPPLNYLSPYEVAPKKQLILFGPTVDVTDTYASFYFHHDRRVLPVVYSTTTHGMPSPSQWNGTPEKWVETSQVPVWSIPALAIVGIVVVVTRLWIDPQDDQLGEMKRGKKRRLQPLMDIQSRTKGKIYDKLIRPRFEEDGLNGKTSKEVEVEGLYKKKFTQQT